MTSDLKELQEKINITFNDEKILFEALTHRSYLNETVTKGLNSNERLEFLGDAVLSFWVSGQIFRKFPELPEGKLTFIRTSLVRTTTLTKLSQNLSFGKYLMMSKGEESGGGKENPALLANCFEAVLGAIYFDQGIEKASQFLQNNFEKLISELDDPDKLKDSKSVLQEKVQAKNDPTPTYKLISSSGPDHKRTFTMGVYVNDKLLGEGTSKSKQEAEEIAAQHALELLD